MSPSRFRPSKTQRLLDLIAFLSSRRRPVGVDAIMERVPGYAPEPDGGEGASEAARRKFERDKADLRDLGVPLESVEATVFGDPEIRYRLRSESFYMPVLRVLAGGGTRGGTELAVRPEELRTAVEGLLHVQELPAFPLRREARSALAKITFDLAPDLLTEGPSRVRHLPPFDPAEVEAVLSLAADALRRRKTLRFGYYAITTDRTERRETHPLGLLYQGSRWYLVARDLSRDDVRIFRVDRMTEVAVEPGSPRTPDYEIDRGHDLSEYRDRKAWDLGDGDEETEVMVRFRSPLSLLAVRNGWGEAVDDDETLRRFRVRAADPLLRWLLTHRGQASIESPGELRDRLAELRRRVLEVHR